MAKVTPHESMERLQPAFISEAGLVFSSFKIREVPAGKPAEPPQPVAPPPAPSRKRISTRELDDLLWPIHKHWPNESWKENWSLYWMPATFENLAHTKPDPRFLRLFENLIEWIKQKAIVRGFTFFDETLTYPHLIEHFLLNAIEYLPLIGMGFCPGKGPIRLPKYDEVTNVDFRAAYRKLTEKKHNFRANDIFPGMPKQQSYIFGDQDLARHNLMGRGGYTFFLSQMSQEQFAEAGKQLLAEFTKDPVMEQMPLVVPLLDSEAFLAAPMELLTKYFGFFDLYVAETPTDRGILIAAAHDLDELLVELVEQTGFRESKRPRAMEGRRDGRN